MTRKPHEGSKAGTSARPCSANTHQSIGHMTRRLAAWAREQVQVLSSEAARLLMPMAAVGSFEGVAGIALGSIIGASMVAIAFAFWPHGPSGSMRI